MKMGMATASYKIQTTEQGNCYLFFCQASGLAVCTTKPVRGNTQKEELQMAWQSEGRSYFNQCHKCGRWVSNVMYNADTLECVDCSPWEDMAEYCPSCGVHTRQGDEYCRKCGKKLLYEGVIGNEKQGNGFAMGEHDGT